MDEHTLEIKFARKKDALDFIKTFSWKDPLAVNVAAFRSYIKEHNDLDLIVDAENADYSEVCFPIDALKNGKITKSGDIWKLKIGPFQNNYKTKKTTKGVAIG